MKPEQVAEYRKAIAPLQEYLMARKAAPLSIFAGGKGATPSSDPNSLVSRLR
jgi:hypothetical protein